MNERTIATIDISKRSAYYDVQEVGCNETEREEVRRINRNLSSRRKRNVYKKVKSVCLFVLAFVMIFILSSTFASLKVDAKGKKGADMVKKYENHFIEPGDTLWDLARERADKDHYDNLGEYLNEVRELNNFTGERLNAGDFILLPYYAECSDEVASLN